MTKMIFFDIDGTLIEMGKKQMTARTEEILVQPKERGILLELGMRAIGMESIWLHTSTCHLPHMQ